MQKVKQKIELNWMQKVMQKTVAAEKEKEERKRKHIHV